MYKKNKSLIFLIIMFLVYAFSMSSDNKIKNLYQKYNVHSDNHRNPINFLKYNAWGNNMKNRQAKIALLQNKEIGVPAELKPIQNNKKSNKNHITDSDSIESRYANENMYDNNYEKLDGVLSNEDIDNLLADFSDAEIEALLENI